MKIAGFAKTSFVDYPGKIACVVFTPHCNMKCGYCHNKHIISGDVPLMDKADIVDYMIKRKDMLGALVITGGEPTLQTGLTEFIKKVKQLGLCVKLDTNGSNPGILQDLLAKNLLDYVAMDVKAPLEKYSQVAGCPIDINAITASIETLKKCSVPYEFRTTFAPALTTEDILEIGDLVQGTKNYCLQQYRQVPGEPPPHTREYVKKTAEKIKAAIGVCELKGT
ncbi:MAG TPA: anaerobic ribonucleoside-triphosphate reductase activating protein [Clostridia bacterium]|nr:anaerobic ribonucleoside-triphosphate reductase activating protein [Clostridia bacterium]